MWMRTGVLTSAGMSAVLDGFQAAHPTVSALDATIPADRLIIDAHRLLWQAALADMTPWQLFRGYDDNSSTKTTDATDVLVKPANAFGFEGRPAQNGHYCRPMTPFSAYGRADELVRVGDGPPVSDVAPFSVPTWLWSSPTADLENPITNRLDDWFREACDIAGQRGVRIHAIYIGGDTRPWEQSAIALPRRLRGPRLRRQPRCGRSTRDAHGARVEGCHRRYHRHPAYLALCWSLAARISHQGPR